MPKPIAIVEAARIALRPIILSRFTVDSCAASARLLIDCLNHFGIPSEPRAVTAFVMNEEAAALLRSGKTPMEVWEAASMYSPTDEDGPWTLSLGNVPGVENDGIGHVVVYVPELRAFVDLSLDQASRPRKRIALEPSIFSGDPTEVNGYSSNGNTVIYYPDSEDKYTISPNWHGFAGGSREVFIQMTDEGIKAMHKLLGNPVFMLHVAKVEAYVNGWSDAP